MRTMAEFQQLNYLDYDEEFKRYGHHQALEPAKANA